MSLDEEGFMAEIERFTKQSIPVQPVEGFGPEEGERAEPIAMGRQTLWGGLGKPPGRDVMAAAAKAARQEMMQRIRDNKAGGHAASRKAMATAPWSWRRPQPHWWRPRPTRARAQLETVPTDRRRGGGGGGCQRVPAARRLHP